jgi:hypothetical protein
VAAFLAILAFLRKVDGMNRTCEVCTHLAPALRTRDPSRRPRPLLLQDRIVWVCDPHGEMVVGTGASTLEHIHALCGDEIAAAPRPSAPL